LIHIDQKPEPENFDQKVRQPGRIFLVTKPNPTKLEWAHKDYWRRSLPDLYEAYGGICAYSAEWIPLEVGVATVDHFEPKAIAPSLAYEWTNFRLASLKLNSRKSTFTDVVDPFTLSDNFFILDFPSLLIKPGQDLSESDKVKATNTIDRLKLNGENSIKSRLRWVRDYCIYGLPLSYIQENAPFVGYELERQGLEELIREIMLFEYS
jgi:hypothetical protein